MGGPGAPAGHGIGADPSRVGCWLIVGARHGGASPGGPATPARPGCCWLPAGAGRSTTTILLGLPGVLMAGGRLGAQPGGWGCGRHWRGCRARSSRRRPPPRRRRRRPAPAGAGTVADRHHHQQAPVHLDHRLLDQPAVDAAGATLSQAASPEAMGASWSAFGWSRRSETATGSPWADTTMAWAARGVCLAKLPTSQLKSRASVLSCGMVVLTRRRRWPRSSH
jgi:hypothetical protein